MLTINELRIYPIKSLGGISVTEAAVEGKGFRYDRRWMLVTPDGQFITQRTYHQMALIDVALTGHCLRVWHRHRPNDVLEIAFDEYTGEHLPVTVWDSHGIDSVVVSEAADRWFTAAVGVPCRLVYMPEESQRQADLTYARNGEIVSFADGFPYLLISQASLDELNRRLDVPVVMLRFRPNIVVAGGEPHQEDGWDQFRIGDLDFYAAKPCARCVLTTVDPATGQKGKEPLRTLGTYRQKNNKIYFGQNVLSQSAGVVRVGDQLEIISHRTPVL
ncbi:MOSC domain-containing protein [Nibrella saemangeumensis]|uniref:MOSC domain-containing protein n=1 Tax=Nibrella saemangeumensis TaxID=1084526 RepID=A0ABP8MVP1_9BACT